VCDASLLFGRTTQAAATLTWLQWKKSRPPPTPTLCDVGQRLEVGRSHVGHHPLQGGFRLGFDLNRITFLLFRAASLLAYHTARSFQGWSS